MKKKKGGGIVAGWRNGTYEFGKVDANHQEATNCIFHILKQLCQRTWIPIAN